MGMTLGATGIHCSYGRQKVLDGVAFEDVPPGSFVALVGPNGAGKSTLFKCLAGLMPHDGEIRVDGRVPSRRHLRSRQKDAMTYLPQEFPVTTALTVFESVLVTARGGGLRVSADHLQEVESTLRRLDLTHLAHRYLTELSGGQRQLVSVAQAVVRHSDVMLLDEPVSNLDLHHQLALLGQIRRLSCEDRVTSIVAIHDLNLAARYADLVLVLHDGHIAVQGTPQQVLTSQMLETVYRVDASVGPDRSGVPVVVPRAALSGPGTDGRHTSPAGAPDPASAGPPDRHPDVHDVHPAQRDPRTGAMTR